jgi:hypothetical protein
MVKVMDGKWQKNDLGKSITRIKINTRSHHGVNSRPGSARCSFELQLKKSVFCSLNPVKSEISGL